jgi:hypothetical protein
MLAEIFMLRLEATARISQEILPSTTSKFMPFDRSDQFVFKDRRERPAEEAPTRHARSGAFSNLLRAA